MPEYKIGNVVKCNVTGIEPYGAFVSIDDGYCGLIHISEISDNFVKSIKDYLQVNNYVYAKIIEVDDKEKRLKLSIKNIDYRNTGKEKDGNGFNILKEKLPIWMEEYKESKK